MLTQQPARASSTKTGRKWVAIASAFVVGLALLALAAKVWRDHRVPTPDAGADRLAQYMSSAQFKALPASQKQPYEHAFRLADVRGEVTAEQRTAVLGNLMPQGRKQPFDAYFALPPGKEREQFLDKAIDQQATLQEKMKSPPSDGPRGGGIRFDGRAMAQSIPPEERAKMDQFMQDLHDRQKARGLTGNGKFLMTN